MLLTSAKEAGGSSFPPFLRETTKVGSAPHSVSRSPQALSQSSHLSTAYPQLTHAAFGNCRIPHSRRSGLFYNLCPTLPGSLRPGRLPCPRPSSNTAETPHATSLKELSFSVRGVPCEGAPSRTGSRHMRISSPDPVRYGQEKKRSRIQCTRLEILFELTAGFWHLGEIGDVRDDFILDSCKPLAGELPTTLASGLLSM